MSEADEQLVYRVEWIPPGKPPTSTTHRTARRLVARDFITVDGVLLAVDRVIPGRRGDPYDGLALCTPVP